MRYKIRNIYIGDQKYEVYLGISKTRYNKLTTFAVHYFLEDPRVKKEKPTKIKDGFRSEQDAVDHGKKYMKGLYRDMLNRQK